MTGYGSKISSCLSMIPAVLAGLLIYSVTWFLSYLLFVPFLINTFPMETLTQRWLLLHANQPIAALIAGGLLAPFYTNAVAIVFAVSIAAICYHFELPDVYRSNFANLVVDPLLVFTSMLAGHHFRRFLTGKKVTDEPDTPSFPPLLKTLEQRSIPSQPKRPRTRPVFKVLAASLFALFCWTVIYWGPIGSIEGDFRLVRPANMAEAPEAKLAEYVEVRKLDLNIYTPSKGFFSRTLWKKFANNPHETAFERVTTENWEEKRKAYEMKLVEKARLAGLDFKSLERSLTAIHADAEDGVATIPVAAYLVRHNWRDAWIIPCKWEHPGQMEAPGGRKVHVSLGHIAVWGIRASTQRILGFTTCK